MIAHYDSEGNSPGAADDGVAVASLLEAMRILSYQEDVKNSIYFLLTDGEEIGSVGADYYCKNPLIKSDTINLAVNFEARGNKGVPFMFETSNNNKEIVKIISKNVSKKWMFSWSNALYKIMPNITDLNKFLEMNYSGINFAMIDGFQNYHSPGDNYQNLSRKSANQYLNTTIDLVIIFKMTIHVS